MNPFRLLSGILILLFFLDCAPEKEKNPKACVEMAAVIENLSQRHRVAYESGQITQEEYISRRNDNENLKISFCLLSLVPVERNTNF